ncbi:MAG: peptidylprolyl isomerase, partial [Christensenellaceae bacterium]
LIWRGNDERKIFDMNKMKKALIIVVCAVMAVSLASCSMVQVNKDRDAAQIVATVNSTNITKGEIQKAIDAQFQMYGFTEESFAQQNGVEQLAAFKKEILTSMVDAEVLYQEAVKQGMEKKTPEIIAEKKTEIEKQLASMKDSMIAAAKDAGEKDPEAAAQKQYDEQIKMYGYDDIDKIVNDQIKNEAIGAMREQINAEITYTEDEAKAYYDGQIAEQQTTIEKDAKNTQIYAQFGTLYVNPAEARYVKNLLLSIPEDVKAEIESLRKAGDDAGADVKRDKALADIKASADAVLARAKGGEDFDALMEELGQDPGMKQEPAKTEGYLVYTDSGMVKPFEEAALALGKEGDISDLVASDFGYHIIQYAKAAGGPVPFENVKEDIMSTKLKEAQTTNYNEKIAALKEGLEIKLFEDRL